jgi:ubiquinone biosynthesis protein
MLAFAQMDARGQLAALAMLGALPSGVDLDALAAGLQEELDAINPAFGKTLAFDQLGTTLSSVLRLLSAHRFRLPKELVLFFKNLLYLTGFTASVAPDADLLGQIEPILGHFMRKYAEHLSALLRDQDQAAGMPA